MSLTEKQFRRLIKEEMSHMEGYEEMTSEEKEELEEGVMDFLRGAKASASGGLAGAAAGAKNVGSAIAAGARGALGVGMGKPGDTIKGRTIYDAATVASLAKAQSIANSYLAMIKSEEGKVEAAKKQAIEQIGKMTFGKMEGQIKPLLLNIIQRRNPRQIEKLVKQLENAKKGQEMDWNGIEAAGKVKSVSKTGGGEVSLAAEAIAESIIRKLATKKAI
jgi:hypothetical protein